MSPKQEKKGMRKTKDRMVHCLGDLRKDTERILGTDRVWLNDLCEKFKQNINDLQDIINHLGGRQ